MKQNILSDKLVLYKNTIYQFYQYIFVHSANIFSLCSCTRKNFMEVLETERGIIQQMFNLNFSHLCDLLHV